MNPRQRLAVVAGAAAASVLAIGLAIWAPWTNGNGASPAADDYRRGTTGSEPAFSVSTSTELARKLRSGVASAVADAVLVPAGTEVPDDFVRELAALRSVTVDPATFKDSGDGTGAVRIATVDSRGRPDVWDATLVARDGHWLIATTAKDVP